VIEGGLVLAAGPVAAAVQSAPQADDQAAASNPSAPAATRAPQTRGEIERALDLVRREHDELVARIGDAEPTQEQSARLEDLETLIRTLEEKLQTVQGGELRNFSLGMNWYLSQVNRVSLNYVHSCLLDSGRANIVLLRYQYNP
jgi:hypothetical protein